MYTAHSVMQGSHHKDAAHSLASEWIDKMNAALKPVHIIDINHVDHMYL